MLKTDAKTLQQWLSWQENLHPVEIDLGLDRVRQVIRVLLPEYYKVSRQDNSQNNFQNNFQQFHFIK